jgi:hypothetical protein
LAAWRLGGLAACRLGSLAERGEYIFILFCLGVGCKMLLTQNGFNNAQPDKNIHLQLGLDYKKIYGRNS